MSAHGDRPPRGAGGAVAPSSDEARVLEVLSRVPATTGYSAGDVIAVAGDLLVLVDGEDENVLRITAGDGSDDYRGANNYGSFTDPAYHGEVSWYTRPGGGHPTWRIRAPDRAVGSSPPARIWARFVAEDGETTDILATRDQARDTADLTAWAAGDDDVRTETPAGAKGTLTLWRDRWDGAPLDVHDVARWEPFRLATGGETPPSIAQVYHRAKAILAGGAGITLTPNDATERISIAADAPQGQQSPGAGEGFSRGAAAPASPAEGDIWSDTTTDKVRRYNGAAWEDLATESYADAGDAVNVAALDGAVTNLTRRAQWARAWIRAATEGAATGGVAAATWTNQGRGSPPTGAHWSPADVPAGAGRLYELVALVSPTPGSATAWTFGAWTALVIDATTTQYSVDGASGWHAVRADADRYERHFAGGAWGPAIALYDGDLSWATLLDADLYHATVHWLPGILLPLPATIYFTRFGELRFGLQTIVGGATVLYSTLTVDPRIFVSVAYADRAATSPAAHSIWQMRLNGSGLSIVHGSVAFGSNGPWANGLDAGLSLVWVRPNAVSSATEAAFLRCIYIRNRGVTHRLRVEGR